MAPPGVLFFANAEQIGGVTDLSLDFLLAIAVIVVGDDRNHHAAAIAAGQFERAAAVIRLVRIAPAHAVAALAFGGLIEMRETQVFLLHAGEMRRQDDAAGMPAPMDGIERRVVFGQVGISAVAENAFHEIEIADQAGGREEAGLHGPLGIVGRCGAHQRAQQERYEQPDLLLLIGRERQRQHVFRRMQRHPQQGREGLFGNGDLVGWNGQSAFDDMEDALRGAAVALGIVQHALRNAIGVQIGRRKAGRVGRKRHLAREARPIEDEGAGGQARGSVGTDFAQVRVEESLNARIGGAEAVAQQLVLLIVIPQQRPGDFEEVRVGREAAGRLAQGGEFQVDVAI